MMAGNLILGGKEVSLELVDIVVSSKGKPIFIECKRPQKEASIDSNFKDAASQLKSRLSSCENSLGIIAIDLTKAVNPEHHLPVAPTNSVFQPMLDGILIRVWERHMPAWQLHKNRQVSGMLLRYSTDILDLTSGTYGYHQQLSMFTYETANSTTQALIELFADFPSGRHPRSPMRVVPRYDWC
jgi:hypothetical protein